MELIFSEKCKLPQLIEKFLVFYGTERSTDMLTEARHFSLTSDTWIESTVSHPTYLRRNLIIFSHLRPEHPRSLSPSGFPTTNR